MFMLGNFIMAIAKLINFVLSAYIWVVIARAVISWVNPDPYNPIVRFLRGVTEPVFYRVRRLLPFTYVSGVDLSPIVVLLAVYFLRTFLVGTLIQVGLGIR